MVIRPLNTEVTNEVNIVKPVFFDQLGVEPIAYVGGVVEDIVIDLEIARGCGRYLHTNYVSRTLETRQENRYLQTICN